MTDAKLSASQRRSLKASTFCGPGRSFPVPDCAHVRAAFRLLNRAKVSDATKSRIRSCISRKNKSLGCGVNEGDNEVVQEIEDLLDSEVFDDTVGFIEYMEEFEAQNQPLVETQDLKDRLSTKIVELRNKRLGLDHNKDQYIQRNINSLVDTLLDEIERSTDSN